MEVLGIKLNLIPVDSVLIRQGKNNDTENPDDFALYDHCSSDGKSLFYRLQSHFNGSWKWDIIATPSAPPRSIFTVDSIVNRSIVSRGTIENEEEALSN